jgi:hypothetical protein
MKSNYPLDHLSARATTDDGTVVISSFVGHLPKIIRCFLSADSVLA